MPSYPDLPVFLPNRDGHGAWVNSRALVLAGIDAVDPGSRRWPHRAGAAASPPGRCRKAPRLVSRLLPEATAQDWDEALLTAQARLLSRWGSPAGRTPPWAAIHRAAPILPTRTCGPPGPGRSRRAWSARCGGTGTGACEQIAELVERRAAGRAGRFAATSVKMMQDGVAEKFTAGMLEPYLDGTAAATQQQRARLRRPGRAPRARDRPGRLGFQVHFHALGDRAVREALDAIEAAACGRATSGADNRHHLAHLQVVHPEDIPRFAALCRRREHPAVLGRARAADGRADHPVPR